MSNVQCHGFKASPEAQHIIEDLVEEIETAVPKASVKLHLDLQNRRHGNLSVAMVIDGLKRRIFVRKSGENLVALLHHIRRVALDRIHRLKDRRVTAMHRVSAYQTMHFE